MASTLQNVWIFLSLLALAHGITTSDNRDEIKTEEIDEEENQDDLDPQETGWIFNPIQDKARTLEYLKDKIIYPFSTLKSPGSSFGGGFPIYTTGGSQSYAWSYPSNSFGSNYFPSPKPKQYYNAGWSYKKPYPAYPYKSWYNNNYYSGGYQANSGTYAPNCYYPPGPSPTSTASPPTFTSGTPLYHYHNSPSPTYGVPGIHYGVPSTPAPISYSSHFQPSGMQDSNTYTLRISSESHPLDGSAQISSLSSANPSNSISSTFSSSTPSTISSPFISTTPTPTLISKTSIPTGPSSIPISLPYQDSVEQEVVIRPSSQGESQGTLPGPKIALPEPSYVYSQPPQYAVAYYPNVFYITNEQRLEKNSQTVSGTNEGSTEVTVVDSSETTTPSTVAQPASEDASPSTKTQLPGNTSPGPGLTTFYSSQTLDQTRIPVSFGQFLPQGGGFYPAGVSSFFSGASGPFVTIPQGVPSSVPTNFIPPLNYLPSWSYTNGQFPVGSQSSRTSKNC